MKILILTRQSEAEWKPVLDEARPSLKELNEEKSVTVKQLVWGDSPIQTYNGNMKGISVPFLRGMIEEHGEGYDMVYIHDSEFQIHGAGGFFHPSLSSQLGIMVMQAFSRLDRLWMGNEFHLWQTNLLIHEILHAKHFKYGLPNKTHDFQAQGNLKGAIENIKAHKEQALIISLLKQMVALLTIKLNLLLAKKEEACSCVQPLTILHHSSTARDWTRKETIERFISEGHKGWTWYNTIIGHNFVIEHKTELNKRPSGHNTRDICVVRTTGEAPNAFQKSELNKRLGDNWITHKEAGEQGIATKSTCPADLTEHLL